MFAVKSTLLLLFSLLCCSRGVFPSSGSWTSKSTWNKPKSCWIRNKMPIEITKTESTQSHCNTTLILLTLNNTSRHQTPSPNLTQNLSGKQYLFIISKFLLKKRKENSRLCFFSTKSFIGLSFDTDGHHGLRIETIQTELDQSLSLRFICQTWKDTVDAHQVMPDTIKDQVCMDWVSKN